VLPQLGLEQRMVDEVRDERLYINTMYRTTNYYVVCFPECVLIQQGRDAIRVVLDRDLFDKFERGDLYEATLSKFSAQQEEWLKMAELSKTGAFARRHMLLAMLPE
jgi:hypothetical protein